MDVTSDHLEDWTPDEIASGRRWVQTWRKAGMALEVLRRRELQELDTFTALSHLMTTADYTSPPFAPRPWSGLVEQQRWFRKAAGRA